MSGNTTPRSRSRAKRSTTNLSNLRLAPLSSKFVEEPRDRSSPKSPYGDSSDPAFVRQHSSYIQGRSAPSTPGVLSRTSSRKRLSGALSRNESYYDDTQDEPDFIYAPIRPGQGSEGPEIGTNLSKAKSEAYLEQSLHQRSSSQGVSASQKSKQRQLGLHRTATAVHIRHEAHRSVDESWLTHTSATASALLQESKGQSWLTSRTNSAGVRVTDSETEDDDENYEEMAAMNASGGKGNNSGLLSGGMHSPTGTRISRWGSRYGSRNGSRRTSRRTSPSGVRTPRRSTDLPDYFDQQGGFTKVVEEPRPFTERADTADDEDEDHREIERLTSNQSFGMGKVVDRFMNFNLFKSEETDEEDGVRRGESQAQAKERATAEATYRKKEEEKRRLAAMPPAPGAKGNEVKGETYGWSDAAWLLSVASKALF